MNNKKCEVCDCTVGNLNSFQTKTTLGLKMVCENCYRLLNGSKKLIGNAYGSKKKVAL